MKAHTPDLWVTRPGPNGPERWRLAPGKEPRLLAPNASPPRGIKSLAAVPVRAALGIPLWVAAEADPPEVVALEFASRHLARKDSTPKAIEIEKTADRRLVLGVGVNDDPFLEPLAGSALFDVSPRLLDPGDAELLLWHEEGLVAYGFYRESRCVFFGTTGNGEVDAPDASGLFRSGLRLHAEEILAAPPTRATLLGEFSQSTEEALGRFYQVARQPWPAPRVADVVDIPPPRALSVRSRRKAVRRAAWIGAAAACFYGLLVAILGGQYLYREARLRSLRSEESAIAGEAAEARDRVERWKTVRRAVDPTDFLLDVLASVVRAIPAETMRLTQFRFDVGLIGIAGEAGDVRQAYAFLERLQAEPALAEYTWDARPPQIGGREIVRFEIEGRRADARTDTE